MSWTPEETQRHVDEVRARAERIAPDDLRPHLLAAVAVHEDRDAVAVAAAFGELWSVDGPESVAAYAERHAAYLRTLLAFELAHEGSATPTMREIAAHAGLGGEFGAWEAALGGSTM